MNAQSRGKKEKQWQNIIFDLNYNLIIKCKVKIIVICSDTWITITAI